MENGPTARERAMTTVIANASPLIYLAAIGKFGGIRGRESIRTRSRNPPTRRV